MDPQKVDYLTELIHSFSCTPQEIEFLYLYFQAKLSRNFAFNNTTPNPMTNSIPKVTQVTEGQKSIEVSEKKKVAALKSSEENKLIT